MAQEAVVKKKDGGPGGKVPGMRLICASHARRRGQKAKKKEVVWGIELVLA
jgi:hypothetical protein